LSVAGTIRGCQPFDLRPSGLEGPIPEAAVAPRVLDAPRTVHLPRDVLLNFPQQTVGLPELTKPEPDFRLVRQVLRD
jgi:hypothetical protein